MSDWKFPNSDFEDAVEKVAAALSERANPNRPWAETEDPERQFYLDDALVAVGIAFPILCGPYGAEMRRLRDRLAQYAQRVPVLNDLIDAAEREAEHNGTVVVRLCEHMATRHHPEQRQVLTGFHLDNHENEDDRCNDADCFEAITLCAVSGRFPMTAADPSGVRERLIEAAAEAIEDESMRWLGRDLGTIHRNDIVAAGLDVALGMIADELRLMQVFTETRIPGFEPSQLTGEQARSAAAALVRSWAADGAR